MSNEDQIRQGENFDPERRNLLLNAGALGLGAVAAAAMGPFAGIAAAEESKQKTLVDAIHGCLKAGEACIDHCLDSFKAGDTAMAHCAASVTEMLAFCAAHGRLASLHSKHLKEMSALAIKVCGDCEKECRKHEKHPPCKACADACAACIKECKKIVG